LFAKPNADIQRLLNGSAALLGMRKLIISFCALWILSSQADPSALRKVIVMGVGAPLSPHAEAAKQLFLQSVGNPKNDPKKGWTCEFEQDLMRQFGKDPQKTKDSEFFAFLKEHHPGYRIAINCGPFGSSADYWEAAVDCGIMPFAPHGNNNSQRFPEGLGLRAAIAVAGGTTRNLNSYGPGLEFIDALALGVGSKTHEIAVQSYANQRTASRFAKILDAHPEYNIWDARQHLRQSASNWSTGWNETNGYGRPNENARIGPLEPGPPVAFKVERSRDRHSVKFTWRNFLQTGFEGTVIARKDGRIIYEGTGRSFVWVCDATGDELFTYWSRNRSGKTSRIESYQRRPVTGLENGPYRSCAILGYPTGQEAKSARLRSIFLSVSPEWNCDELYRTGNPFYDRLTNFPYADVVGVLPDRFSMIDFVRTNHHRIVVAPTDTSDGDFTSLEPAWNRAVDAGIIVVMPHHYSLSPSRKPQARRLSPPRLSAAIHVGYGTNRNFLSFGPGREFFDAPTPPAGQILLPNQADAAAVIAGKLARILDRYPHYNSFDARQHLRMCSSLYNTGWIEDGGYGRPPTTIPSIDHLEPAPPLDIKAAPDPESRSVRLSWRNFLQTSFAATVIRADETEVYSGTGTNLVLTLATPSPKTLCFFTKDGSGKLSRSEAYTAIDLEKLLGAKSH
jgi:hypothetical protein